MAGTPKSMLGRVQTDPIQGYKGLSSLSQGFNSGEPQQSAVDRMSDAAPDHTHADFEQIQRVLGDIHNRMPSSNQGLLGDQYSKYTKQLGNMSPPVSGGGLLSEPPGFPGYDNLPSNWAEEGYSWTDPKTGIRGMIIS